LRRTFSHIAPLSKTFAVFLVGRTCRTRSHSAGRTWTGVRSPVGRTCRTRSRSAQAAACRLTGGSAAADGNGGGTVWLGLSRGGGRLFLERIIQFCGTTRRVYGGSGLLFRFTYHSYSRFSETQSLDLGLRAPSSVEPELLFSGTACTLIRESHTVSYSRGGPQALEAGHAADT
jgi:hypothetical protein